jgi:hypothetical protein
MKKYISSKIQKQRFIYIPSHCFEFSKKRHINQAVVMQGSSSPWRGDACATHTNTCDTHKGNWENLKDCQDIG